METEYVFHQMDSDVTVPCNGTIKFNADAGFGLYMMEKLHSLKKSHILCDVIIQATDREYPVHRNVLAACSPYFETALKTESDRKIIVDTKYPEMLDMVIDYMYTGSVTIQADSISEILRLANNLSICKLKDHCCEYLKRSLSINTCFKVRDLADNYDLSLLTKTAEAFIVANIQEIVAQNELLELHFSKLEQLIARSMPISELQRVQLIFRWTYHRFSSRQSQLPSLLAGIYWRKVCSMELKHMLMDTPLLVENKWCKYQVLASLKKACLLPDVYFLELNELRAKFEAVDITTDGNHDNTEAQESNDFDGAMDTDNEDQAFKGRFC